LSKLMTPLVRCALLPAVPLHADSAPAPGTGKSYLADVASAIAIGERCAVVAVAPKPDETEKRLIGAALAGHPIIAIDNCNGVLTGDFLCQVSERPVLQVRPLGSSAVVKLPNIVRSALVWLGCADPVNTIATARADDPARQARAAFFGAWATELDLAPASFLTAELIQWALEDSNIGWCKRPRFRAAMFDVARHRRGDGIDPVRLGLWLNRSLNNVVDGHKLTVDRSDAARPRWSLS
jgi:hypothetical protein